MPPLYKPGGLCEGSELEAGERQDDRPCIVEDEAEVWGRCDVDRFPRLPKGEKDLSVDTQLHLRAWRRLPDRGSPQFAYLRARIEGSALWDPLGLGDSVDAGRLIRDPGSGGVRPSDVELLVFVDVGHAQEFVEGVPQALLVGMPVLRLRLLDDCELGRVGRDPEDRGSRSFGGVPLLDVLDPLISGEVDRELGVFPGVLLRRPHDGAIDAEVEGGANVVDEVPEPDSESLVRLLSTRPSHDIPLIASGIFDLMGGEVEVCFNELSHLCVDEVQMLSRPLQLENGSLDFDHALTLEDDGTQVNGPKPDDPEGVRDPGADPQGVLRGAREGGEKDLGA